jgi:hypothetical protein
MPQILLMNWNASVVLGVSCRCAKAVAAAIWTKGMAAF